MSHRPLAGYSYSVQVIAQCDNAIKHFRLGNKNNTFVAEPHQIQLFQIQLFEMQFERNNYIVDI